MASLSTITVYQETGDTDKCHRHTWILLNFRQLAAHHWCKYGKEGTQRHDIVAYLFNRFVPYRHQCVLFLNASRSPDWIVISWAGKTPTKRFLDLGHFSFPFYRRNFLLIGVEIFILDQSENLATSLLRSSPFYQSPVFFSRCVLKSSGDADGQIGHLIPDYCLPCTGTAVENPGDTYTKRGLYNQMQSKYVVICMRTLSPIPNSPEKRHEWFPTNFTKKCNVSTRLQIPFIYLI